MLRIAGDLQRHLGLLRARAVDDRLDRYYDDPTKFGIVLAMVWAVVGLFVGDWVAWLLVYPGPRPSTPAGRASAGCVRFTPPA